VAATFVATRELSAVAVDEWARTLAGMIVPKAAY